VDGETITKGAVAHWLHIIAVRDYELKPTRPVPTWVIPDPPAYKECTDHLAGTARPSSPRTRAYYRTECKQEYERLKQQTLDFLITGAWFIQEGRARGMRETDQEVRKRVARALKAEFGGLGGFARDRKFIGETYADEMFRSRFKIYSEKMEVAFKTASGRTPTQRGRIFTAWVEAFPKKWAAHTTCSRGYVVPDCREYKGSEQPHIQL
jgi:hypothetical protein